MKQKSPPENRIEKFHQRTESLTNEQQSNVRSVMLVALMYEVSEERFNEILAFGLKQVVKSEQPVTGVAVNRIKDEPLGTVAKLADA